MLRGNYEKTRTLTERMKNVKKNNNTIGNVEKTIRITFFIRKRDYKNVKMISVCVENRNNTRENLNKILVPST